MLYQTELPEHHRPTLGIEPRTITSSIRCSTNWAIWAQTIQILETGSKLKPKRYWFKFYTAIPKCSAETQTKPKVVPPRRVFFFPSHNMQSSVKLCNPDNLNAPCQSEWIALGLYFSVGSTYPTFAQGKEVKIFRLLTAVLIRPISA